MSNTRIEVRNQIRAIQFFGGAILLAGALLRFGGLFNDLWLDEIWSLEAARAIASPADLFTTRTLDGHSSLYTLVLWLIGAAKPAWAYRLFSFLCSLGSLIVVWDLGKRAGVLERFFGTLLLSFSYLLILYGSEARGYGPLVFFALLSFHQLRRAVDEESWKWIASFWISSAAGFLFHFTFVEYFAAAAVWSAVRLCRQRRGILRIFELHAVPALIIAITYFSVIRFQSGATGPLGSYWDVVVDTLNITFGAPLLSAFSIERDLWLLGSALLIGGLLLVELILEFRERNPDAVFFALAVFVSPALSVILLHPRVLVVRYFLLASLFAYPLAARFLSRIAKRDTRGAVLAVLFTGACLFGQGVYLQRFALYGRGTYSAALSYIHSVSHEPAVIAGDQDFRNRMVVRFYAERLGVGDKLRYASSGSEEAGRAEWYLVQSQDPLFIPEAQVGAADGRPFIFDRTFPFTALSGWSWSVYRACHGECVR